NSLAAHLDDATPRVIADAATGRVIVPSVVSFPNGEAVVGDEARALAPTGSAETIQSVKRYMGLGREHLSAADRQRYSFAEDDGRVLRFVIGEGRAPTPEISAPHT